MTLFSNQAVRNLMVDVFDTLIKPREGKLEYVNPKSGREADGATIADQEAEAALIKGLTNILPGSLVFGEESFDADPSSVSVFQTGQPVWVIDPIDGTLMFKRGQGIYGVMVALVLGGEVASSWVYQSTQDLYEAHKGKGVTLNGAHIKPQLQKDSWFGELIIEHFKEQHYDAARMDEIINIADTAFMASAEKFPRLVTGSYKAINYGGHCKAWDIAPGLLMLEEVGAQGRLLNGQRVTLQHLVHRTANPEAKDIMIFSHDDDTYHFWRDKVKAILSV